MPKMTHLLLVILIIGCLHAPAFGGETSPDYEYEDTAKPPENIEKSTATPRAGAAAVLPYFEQPEETVYVQPDAKQVTLTCPVRNYNNTDVIFWYRDDEAIANGKTAMVANYTLNAQFSLSTALDNAKGHSFSCRLMKANLSHLIRIAIGAPPPPTSSSSNNNTTSTNTKPSSAAALSWSAASSCLLLGALWSLQQAAVAY